MYIYINIHICIYINIHIYISVLSLYHSRSPHDWPAVAHISPFFDRVTSSDKIFPVYADMHIMCYIMLYYIMLCCDDVLYILYYIACCYAIL
jgi:hypothetical protein